MSLDYVLGGIQVGLVTQIKAIKQHEAGRSNQKHQELASGNTILSVKSMNHKHTPHLNCRAEPVLPPMTKTDSFLWFLSQGTSRAMATVAYAPT